MHSHSKNFPFFFSVKRKTLQNSLNLLNVLKSSKRKQKLYEKFVKKRSLPSENTYKAYKYPFESLKKNLENILLKTSRKLSKRYKENVGYNQEDYRESKIT